MAGGTLKKKWIGIKKIIWKALRDDYVNHDPSIDLHQHHLKLIK